MSDPDAATMTHEEIGAWWATSVTRVAPGEIDLRGYAVQDVIGRLGFVEVVWLLLRGERPDPARARMLEAALVASVDHGPQAPSIAAARMAATCGLGLNSAVATGVNLLGDVHGGAGQQCVALLHRMADLRAAGGGAEAVAEAVVAEYRERGAYVPGFGHRFHPRDPRRDPLLAMVREAVEDGVVDPGPLESALALEKALAARRTRPVPMNIDGATAVVYACLGFDAELARGLFVLSRSVGILAHAWEESRGGARIKGPLPRQVLAAYTGPPTRALGPDA
ncbi:citryl-CoA lyase [Streptomonospora nanhaiensis]|uniref:citrate synthase (unknown stereospecificity) n=1 Tax=Streptomonospora nanhaiensis TaxID=1323731 RepID=A0A853BID3_9ACTN|nr:citryl-CoA lyase [Streptomonospora nanhaiensis]MBV2365047.1 citryl-CoA lyase [Streptomonospora nanhaiensis]MBX9388284.1 citryl-CoA lyase [Streptomonospora nanhaiensis]NYI94495.1 citrate synthase [Streptomonospora nanhaiensis]